MSKSPNRLTPKSKEDALSIGNEQRGITHTREFMVEPVNATG